MVDGDGWLAFIAGVVVGVIAGFAIGYVLSQDNGVVIERDLLGRIVAIMPAKEVKPSEAS